MTKRRSRPPRKPGAKKPRKKTDIAKTALGAEPEKRGRAAVSEPAEGDPARGGLKVRVKTARGRKLSSTRWLERQLNDPYVAKAKAAGYRSRAAFKLVEIDARFALLKPGARVADLGAAPGGWCQFAAKKVGSAGRVVGIDLEVVEPIPGVTLLQGDFLDEEAQARMRDALGGAADLVLSDMAAASSGHRQTDHLRIIALCDAALSFAETVLTPGGAFCAKVLRGGAEGDLLRRLKSSFAHVRHFKPPASRSDSAEIYVVASGYRGAISGVSPD
ncbi:MAG: RlmE family RNA methyltransferase [Pseudomonadota bacterium]